MTVGCTIHFSSGDVEIAVTVGTKEAAALVSVSWKNPHQTDMHMHAVKYKFSVSDEWVTTLLADL